MLVAFISNAKYRIPELAERAKALKMSAGYEDGADLGPVVSKAVRFK